MIFNDTILNIKTNFIPHETKIFNDQEPPWINNKVKTMIQEKKKKFYQLYLKNKSNILATIFETFQNQIYETLKRRKTTKTFLKNYVLKPHLRNIIGCY